jgi:hypothetical protein
MENKYKIIERLASCFTDNREKYRIKHTLTSLLTQRIFGICQGYEDLNDHDILRSDPLLQYVCGKKNGAVAGKSTLNRLELGKEPYSEDDKSRYCKIDWEDSEIEDLFCTLFLESFEEVPIEIILDFDATDVPIYGDQQSKFFHGYYDDYCFMPLYVFGGDFLLAAKLRPSNIDAAKGTTEILEKLVLRIREHFPDVNIIFRGDSGFCRDDILSLCESLQISYVVGIPRNSRLTDVIHDQMAQVKKESKKEEKAVREFTRFEYQTKDSWENPRSIVAKVEHLPGKENPRFIVTNISEKQWDDRSLYEDLYCGRGDMENRIKEQKLDLFSDRTSTWWMSSNQLRLWFSAFAYTFFVLLKRALPVESKERSHRPETIRLKLLKVAVVFQESVRRIVVVLPKSYPYWGVWVQLSKSL